MTPSISPAAITPVPPTPHVVDASLDFFSKLPTELLKYIVDIVRTQDQAWMTDGRIRGVEELSPEEADDDSADSVREGQDVNVAAGRWAAAYGEGVKSLSRVNKALRGVTLPLLLETVTACQLESAFCHFHILGSDLGALITHLDLSEATETVMLDIARSLPLLSSVITVTLHTSIAPFLDRAPTDVRPEWKVLQGNDREIKKEEVLHRENARQALHTLLSRISSLHLVTGMSDDIADVLQKPALPPTLDRLHLSSYTRLFSAPDVALLQRLQAFNLRQLSIETTGRAYSFWGDSLRLPTLEVLECHPDFLGDTTLAILPSVAPTLSTLRLRPARSLDFFTFTSSVHPCPYPHLRNLHLSLLAFHKANNPLPQLFDFFAASPHLRTIDLSLARLNIPLREILPPPSFWPPSLRRLRVRIVSASRLDDDEAFRIELAATRGIELEICWTPAKHYDSYSDEDERETTAIKNDLQWALRRIEGLQRTGDRAGVEELVETLGLLRQRRIIEEQ